MNTDAVVPNRSAMNFINEVKAEKRDLSIDKKDSDLHVLSTTPGWKDLKEYINNLKDSLKPEIDMSSGSDDEMFRSYGMRMVLYELASKQLDLVVARVEDASNEVERNINKKSK